MERLDRFDSLIQFHCVDIGLPFDWRWVKTQALIESGMDPKALSPVGAAGLLQLMPATDMEIDGEIDGFEIEGNLKDGILYLKQQYDKLGEIPDQLTRIWCALASYNGGRGNINSALAGGRKAEGLPEDYRAWKKQGSRRGKWQTWPEISYQLRQLENKPDWRQMIDYVDRITRKYIELTTPQLGD